MPAGDGSMGLVQPLSGSGSHDDPEHLSCGSEKNLCAVLQNRDHSLVCTLIAQVLKNAAKPFVSQVPLYPDAGNGPLEPIQAFGHGHLSAEGILLT